MPALEKCIVVGRREKFLNEKYKGYTICPGHGAVKQPEL